MKLASVRIGDVQVYNVEATVCRRRCRYILLGNSFLDRFQMRRENDRLTLREDVARAVAPSAAEADREIERSC